jgi:hypothetical protein
MSRIAVFRSIFFSLLTTSFAFCGNAAIDLTAVPRDYVAEGITHKELTFRDGERTVVMELPNKWTFRNNSGRLELVPPQTKFAEGVIQAIPLDAPQPLDEAAKKALAQRVLGEVPPKSDGIAVEERENPVLINGHESFEVVISYKTLGYTFQSSTIFVNCPETQLIFRFTAPKADFEALNKVFRRAILSWQWIEPHNLLKE